MSNVVVCDKCSKEFECGSIQIKECSVEIEGNKLLLDYFICPYCNAVYKVLLVDESKYRKLVHDIESLQKEVRNEINTLARFMLLDMVEKKKRLIKECVNEANKMYNGNFVLLGGKISYVTTL